MDVSTIETLVGRNLTTSELGTVLWLQGWGKETQDNVMTLIVNAWQHGFVSGRPRKRRSKKP